MAKETFLKSTEFPPADVRFRILEEAQQAVMTLKTLKGLLSPQDTESLSLLLDQELMVDLEASLAEAAAGQVEPLEVIR
ncbi:MAG: hypothetical protein A2445_00280 [Candidatus Jacksonbacteria bacterium RIFOXYC2_FULL_44_29]|nr:MAG: hypothetical protein UV19_C0006G0033 [Parcubacteria group bacterium GW2011_GWA2_42_28]KKT54728.1 MAG: hypothetical protein UW45_C0012G0033 [Parcubacteria group bacterium GW2011_GWC2_44_22]OGY75326.1 MAG: hypothetical protein A2240_01790 [Candidatus Jacksonbacteria bacterium RIFOXYA2_FULL_43_12]OGY76236.1 MAG: hypothetical protein A2295_05875 [Candidatus Jacksonbacteria bacterium RIFOXYB2_FULL_44_15]OGY78091.1 MAG: hypothetical protein A2445_00280 [Candidatus Jacksonbacteria bacterium RI